MLLITRSILFRRSSQSSCENKMDTPDAVSGQPSIKIVRRPRVQTARGLWRLRSRRNALPPLSPGKAFPPLADSRTNELSRPAATSTKLPAMSASAAPNHANPAPVPGRDPGAGKGGTMRRLHSAHYLPPAIASLYQKWCKRLAVHRNETTTRIPSVWWSVCPPERSSSGHPAAFVRE